LRHKGRGCAIAGKQIEFGGFHKARNAFAHAGTTLIDRLKRKRNFLAVLSFLGFSLGLAMNCRAGPQNSSGQMDQGTPADSRGTQPPPQTQKKSREKNAREPSAMGSPYVPLDSWIYPALERLIATGHIEDAFLGIRPWTRIECARLLDEIQGKYYQVEDELSPEDLQLYNTLTMEFSTEITLLDGGENNTIRLESVYSRITGISGQPLTDGYHLGETITNDFGRPYQEGFNNVTGFSGWAAAGRWIAYVNGEYQHAPSGPALSDPVRAFIAHADQILPAQVPTGIQRARNQLRLQDAYVGVNAGNWQFSFGQRSIWWGPGTGGGMMLSDNAPPVTAFHVDRVAPFRLPGFLGLIGPIRMEAFFGQLAGHSYPPRPFFHGEKISFKPTANLEIGFSRTAEMGGVGRPLTFASLFNSYFSIGHSDVAAYRNPGKRTAGLEFSYRVPFVRDWLTLYTDALADDDPTPLVTPRRSAYNPGIYMPQIPGILKLDLRIEAAYTNLPEKTASDNPGNFVYFDSFYKDLYTNKGHLMGHWVGRDGTGIQAWSRYLLSSRNSLQFGYRHEKVDPRFVPGGATINDGSVRVDVLVKPEWNLNVYVQYEKWNFPLLASHPQTNMSTSMQFTYTPAQKAHE
jgi:hypothetical protein